MGEICTVYDSSDRQRSPEALKKVHDDRLRAVSVRKRLPEAVKAAHGDRLHAS